MLVIAKPVLLWRVFLNSGFCLLRSVIHASFALLRFFFYDTQHFVDACISRSCILFLILIFFNHSVIEQLNTSSLRLLKV